MKRTDYSQFPGPGDVGEPDPYDESPRRHANPHDDGDDFVPGTARLPKYVGPIHTGPQASYFIDEDETP